MFRITTKRGQKNNTCFTKNVQQKTSITLSYRESDAYEENCTFHMN